MNTMFYGASSFRSDLRTWSIENVVDMTSMFEQASSFNADLYEWGNRFTLIGASPSTVKVVNMFRDSGCYVDESPTNFEQGPWCTEISSAILFDLFG